MFSTKNNQQTQRLSSGGLIDRSKPIAFKFDGKPLMGYDGDTLASALLANNIKLVGRSFKYHRPRGIYTAGTEEPNALVALRSNARTEPTREQQISSCLTDWKLKVRTDGPICFWTLCKSTISQAHYLLQDSIIKLSWECQAGIFMNILFEKRQVWGRPS